MDLPDRLENVVQILETEQRSHQLLPHRWDCKHEVVQLLLGCVLDRESLKVEPKGLQVLLHPGRTVGQRVGGSLDPRLTHAGLQQLASKQMINLVERDHGLDPAPLGAVSDQPLLLLRLNPLRAPETPRDRLRDRGLAGAIWPNQHGGAGTKLQLELLVYLEIFNRHGPQLRAHRCTSEHSTKWSYSQTRRQSCVEDSFIDHDP